MILFHACLVFLLGVNLCTVATSITKKDNPLNSGVRERHVGTKYTGSPEPVEDSMNEDTSRVEYVGYKLYNVSIRSKQEARTVYQFSTLDGVHFWTIHRWTSKTGGYAHLLLAPNVIDNVTSALDSMEISYRVMVEDIQKFIDAFQAEEIDDEEFEVKYGHRMSWDRYHRLRDIYSFLDYLNDTQPDICRTIVIGKTTEGRDMVVVKVSDPTSRQNKPAIWIDSGIHAREWVSPATTTYMLQQLVDSRELLEDYDFYILPVSNPDGYEYTHTRDRLWRKTRSRNSYSYFCYGSDPNRNWDFHWGESGSSQNPCSNIYAGPKAFSEPETKAMSDFILQNKDQIKIFVTYHSYSQLLLLPWGHTKELAEDHEELSQAGAELVKAIKGVHGKDYEMGSTANILYAASGGSHDWAKGVAGIKYSYAVELRDTGDYGFLLPPSEIIPTAEENWKGLIALARAVKSLENNEIPMGL